MAKAFHRKLIRDNAPSKMREGGVAFETRKLEDAEFKSELLRKIVEEATELGESETREEIAAELADILDVIDETKKTYGISEAELEKARALNTQAKGGFRQRLFLEWSEGGSYKANEK
jgi:predicted house-cleaning noncanonical NTP pyrophosphatase (MazG superfamily)